MYTALYQELGRSVLVCRSYPAINHSLFMPSYDADSESPDGFFTLPPPPHPTQVGEQWERALSLLRDMPKRGVEPVVISYNTVISACGKCGEGDQVRQIQTYI